MNQKPLSERTETPRLLHRHGTACPPHPHEAARQSTWPVQHSSDRGLSPRAGDARCWLITGDAKVPGTWQAQARGTGSPLQIKIPE